MFNKKQNQERNEMTPISHPGAPTPAPADPPGGGPATTPAGGASTLLAEGCTFDGKAKVEGTLRIEGKANGEIDVSESLVVGKSGKVEAQAKTRRAILNGRFQGKIDAEEGVELQAGSHVEADISAKNMVMEDGVRFTGNCKIGQ